MLTNQPGITFRSNGLGSAPVGDLIYRFAGSFSPEVAPQGLILPENLPKMGEVY
jgi:hypothetical protein